MTENMVGDLGRLVLATVTTVSVDKEELLHFPTVDMPGPALLRAMRMPCIVNNG